MLAKAAPRGRGLTTIPTKLSALRRGQCQHQFEFMISRLSKVTDEQKMIRPP